MPKSERKVSSNRYSPGGVQTEVCEAMQQAETEKVFLSVAPAVTQYDIDGWMREFDESKCALPVLEGGGGEGIYDIIKSDMETGKMPEEMRKFITKSLETGKLYLLSMKNGAEFVIVTAKSLLTKLSGAVIIGAYTKVNMDILLRLYNGQCIIWNNYGALGMVLTFLSTKGSNIVSLSYEVFWRRFPGFLKQTLSLATGLQYRGAIAVSSICSCLFVYLLHKFFTKIEGAQSLDQDAINQARQTYLKKLLKDHTHRITRKEVKMAAEDKEISDALTKIAVRVVQQGSTSEILNLYIKLFKKTSERNQKVRKIIAATEALKYLSGVLYKNPAKDIQVAWGDIKAMISLLIGKESITYDTDKIRRDTKKELIKLELNQFITEDLPNLVLVLKVSKIISQFMKKRSSVNRGTKTDRKKIKKRTRARETKNLRSSESGTESDPGTGSGTGSGTESESKSSLKSKSSSSMGGSSRKQRNKRKTIRRKVSKIKKRTLNKKSKKGKKSKKLRK